MNPEFVGYHIMGYNVAVDDLITQTYHQDLVFPLCSVEMKWNKHGMNGQIMMSGIHKVNLSYIGLATDN